MSTFTCQYHAELVEYLVKRTAVCKIFSSNKIKDYSFEQALSRIYYKDDIVQQKLYQEICVINMSPEILLNTYEIHHAESYDKNTLL